MWSTCAVASAAGVMTTLAAEDYIIAAAGDGSQHRVSRSCSSKNNDALQASICPLRRPSSDALRQFFAVSFSKVVH